MPTVAQGFGSSAAQRRDSAAQWQHSTMQCKQSAQRSGSAVQCSAAQHVAAHRTQIRGIEYHGEQNFGSIDAGGWE